jgi:hypothetical protein
MSGYKDVEDELAAGTPAELLCATCPWDRLCVQPPQMTKQQVDRQLDKAKSEDEAQPDGRNKMPMATLMTTLMLAGKDKTGQLCPVFALRLRGPDGRQVADGIRSMMRANVGGAA